MPPLKLQPRQNIEYKKPSRINPVSISVFLFFGGMVYLGYSCWPALRVSSGAKSEMADVLPHLYRANLQSDALVGQRLLDMKKDLFKALRKAGVKDPKLEIKLLRDQKVVAIEAKFRQVVKFEGTDYKFEIPFSPRVETNAARVDW